MSKILAPALSLVLALAVVGARPTGEAPIRLRDLVPRGDPLARQDLTFDARFARTAVEYARQGTPALLDTLAASPAARHLLNHARQLYYAIHELHHVGVNTYQPPPRISDIKTCADLLRLVDYSTQLEGLAVYVARARRAAEGALGTDPDYVALEDPAQMRVLEERYDEQYRYLQARGIEPVDKAAWAVVDRMSSGDRLWYRVGARMAARVEQQRGRDALVALIAGRHPALVETYRRIVAAR